MIKVRIAFNGSQFVLEDEFGCYTFCSGVSQILGNDVLKVVRFNLMVHELITNSQNQDE